MAACPACGVDCVEPFQELSAYTLTHGAPAFIHQHVVDAYGALHGGFQGGARGKSAGNIGLAFSLLGLYLAAEKGYTGRQVQIAHIALAQWRKAWPKFALTPERAAVTVVDVMKADPGAPRDEMVKRWARAAWEASSRAHDWTRETWSQFIMETEGARRGR